MSAVLDTPPGLDAHLLDYALAYAKLGFNVFPLYQMLPDGRCACGHPDCFAGTTASGVSPGKHPITGSGCSDATNAEATIRAWWKRYPSANIGLHLGRSNLVAVDIDPRNGGSREGLPDDIPDTLTASTGGGGEHIIYRVPDGREVRSGKLATGIDTKRGNAYIVVEPSNHASGRRYSFLDFDILAGEIPDIAAAPEWLLEPLGASATGSQTPPKGRQLAGNVHIDAGTADELRSALAVLDADDYKTWIDAAHYLHECGEAGFSIWDEWSQTSPKYDAAISAHKWNSIRPLRKAHGYRGLFQRAQAAGWINPMRGGGSSTDEDQPPETFDDLQASIEDMRRKDRPGPMIGRIVAAQLERGDEDALLRMLKDQVGGRLRDYRADVIAKKKAAGILGDAAGDSEPDHLEIAERIASPDNLVFTQSFFWGFDAATGIWERAEDQEVKAHIAKVCRDMKQAVVQSRVSGSFDLAKAHFFRRVEFDRGSHRDVCAANGVLTHDARGWALKPYRREDYRRVRLPVTFDPRATAPRFERFLAEVFAGAEDGAERAQAALEFIGLALIQSCEFEKALFAVGSGGNGKSVYLSVIEAMVGPYRAAVALSQLDNRFQRAHLDGKLVNLVSEIPIGAELPDAALKALISGEPITAEHKMRPPFEFRPTATFVFATNHLPNIRDFSEGLFRRLLVLRFDRTFKDRPDTRLAGALRAELPGILNLALDALGQVFERGALTIPPSSLDAVQGWRDDSDQVRTFTEDCCDVDPYSKLTTADLFKAYMDWAQQNRQRHTLGRRTFTERIVGLGFQTTRVGAAGARGIAGLCLKRRGGFQ